MDIVDIPPDLVPWLRKQNHYILDPELEATYEARRAERLEKTKVRVEDKIWAELTQRQRDAELLGQAAQPLWGQDQEEERTKATAKGKVCVERSGRTSPLRVGTDGYAGQGGRT